MTLTKFDKSPSMRLAGVARIERRMLARAYGRALLALAPLVLMYWVVPAKPDWGQLHDLINSTMPFYFIFVLILLALKVLKRMPDAIWTGAFWFPLQSAIFYGFGPLVEVYGNEVTRMSLSAHVLGVSDFELFRAHKLSTTGITFILLGFWLHLNLRLSAWANKRPRVNPSVPVAQLGLIFVSFGAILKYFIMLPAQWGMIGRTVPGVLSGLGNVIDIGFAIMAFMAASGDRRQRALFWLLWPIHFSLSFLPFAKSGVVIAMLLPLLGAFMAHRRRGRLVLGMAIISIVFTSYQPLVHYGRGVILRNTGGITNADYSQRVAIIADYFVERESYVPTDIEEDRQGSWTRLSTAGPQAFAMNLYDQGNRNRSLDYAWMYFIPRAIWPGKPIMSGPGLEFYRQVTGNKDANSFLGLSIYGDLYWQYGWSGVCVGGVLVGWLFAVISSQSVRAVRRRDLIMMPAVLIALEMTLLGPNKYVINGIVGPMPIYIFYLFMGTIMIRHFNFEARRRGAGSH